MVTCTTRTPMVPSPLLVVLVISGWLYGQAALPPLPMKDGCFRVSPELDVFRLEGEAVVLACPFFQSVTEFRHLLPPGATHLITKGNGTEGVAHGGHALQRDRQLWLLPAQPSDSGEYTCIYRNETYCIAGSITLRVYESASVDMEKLSHPVDTRVGKKVSVQCPHLDLFDRIEQIEWHKDSSSTALSAGSGFSYQTQRPHLMSISAVKPSHQGLYTCRVRVLVDSLPYTVSGSVQLRVKGYPPVVPDPDPVYQTSGPHFTTTTDAPTDSSGPSSVNTPSIQSLIQSPRILSPLNGTIYEAAHGSGLEMVCTVFIECQSAASTAVTWLVNGQSVESSYLERRGLQGGRRVTRVSGGCQVELRLVVIGLSEEDTRAELKCVTQNQGGRQEIHVLLRFEDWTFTWLVVGAVAVSCVMAVVSTYLYHIFKPKTKTDYFLARQNSYFSTTNSEFSTDNFI